MELLRDRIYYFIGIFFFLVTLIALLILYPEGKSFFIINGVHHSFFDTSFKYLTHIGDGITAIIVLSLLLLFYRTGAGLIGLLGLGAVGIFSFVMKYCLFTNHPRPHLYFWKNKMIHYIDGVDVNIENSFPSGHTFTAFYVCTFICLLSIGKQISIQLALLIAAILAAYSRVYLAQHFIGDIVAGALLGIALALCFYFIYYKTRKRSYMKHSLMHYILPKK